MRGVVGTAEFRLNLRTHRNRSVLRPGICLTQRPFTLQAASAESSHWRHPRRYSMSVQGVMRQGGSAVPDPAEGVRVVKPLQFDYHTPQTNGMRRLAAVSNVLVGSEALW